MEAPFESRQADDIPPAFIEEELEETPSQDGISPESLIYTFLGSIAFVLMLLDFGATATLILLAAALFSFSRAILTELFSEQIKESKPLVVRIHTAPSKLLVDPLVDPLLDKEPAPKLESTAESTPDKVSRPNLSINTTAKMLSTSNVPDSSLGGVRLGKGKSGQFLFDSATKSKAQPPEPKPKPNPVTAEAVLGKQVYLSTDTDTKEESKKTSNPYNVLQKVGFGPGFSKHWFDSPLNTSASTSQSSNKERELPDVSEEKPPFVRTPSPFPLDRLPSIKGPFYSTRERREPVQTKKRPPPTKSIKNATARPKRKGNKGKKPDTGPARVMTVGYGI